MVSLFSFLRSNARRSALRVLSTVMLITASIGLLAGCANGSATTLPLGSWESSFGEVYTITGTSVAYSGDGTSNNYDASIVYVDDSSLNADDTSVTADGNTAVNPGFAVIKYTSVADASYGEDGKYNIFRWADGSSEGERIMTQGGKYEGTFGEDDFRLIVFDSVSEAIEEATNENGFFQLASTVTAQE